jgi:signal transduction histidine kinase
LSRSLEAARPLLKPSRLWIFAALALGLAIGTGLLLAKYLMNPSAGDMGSLAVYLTLSGTVTVGAGWLALRFADRAIGLSLRTKAFVGAAIGSVVALLNVLIVAQLMFVSKSHDLKLLFALLAFSGIVTIFFSLRVASTVAGRIGALAAQIRVLAAGDYSLPVDAAGDDEVDRLATDVDILRRQLLAAEDQRRALDKERRDLTAAISHDLRTPLASVRAMVEALHDEVVDDPEEVRHYHATIKKEIERLNRMLDDLFDLARMDAGAFNLDRRPIDFQEIVTEVVDAAQARARREGVALNLVVQGRPPTLHLDGTRIERAVTNLVSNALEHTASGGSVELTVDAANDRLELSVSDSGEGIHPDDLPHVWERFYRGEKSRNRRAQEADGAGLGLAIVEGIVKAHGGTVHAASTPGRGSTFIIRLPHSQSV